MWRKRTAKGSKQLENNSFFQAVKCLVGPIETLNCSGFFSGLGLLKRSPIVETLPADAEAICVYRGQAWRGWAAPYFERWPEFKEQRPKGDQLLGTPYPAAETQL